MDHRLMATSEITVWAIWNFRDRTLDHNHISDGYDPVAREPTPMCEHQKIAWQGRNWRPQRAWLVDGVVTSVSATGDGHGS